MKQATGRSVGRSWVSPHKNAVATGTRARLPGTLREIDTVQPALVCTTVVHYLGKA